MAKQKPASRPRQIHQFLVNTFTKHSKVEIIKKILKKNLRGLVNLEDAAIETAADIAKGLPIDDAVRKNIWRVYAKQVDTFAMQTAHLIVGRLIMYLVGVDKNAWNAITVQNVTRPFLALYWNIRSQMSDMLPSVYFLNEFDWLYIDDITRQSLSVSQNKIVHLHEDKLDKALGRLYSELTVQYDYSQVNMDVWKSVYQGFLPPEEVNKLGFVTTPDEVVDLILDLVEYTERHEQLCKAKILDPACGSGTFLVEAVNRLRKHLETNMKCHETDFRKPPWVREKAILENIISCVHGIDVHPFAAFLTSMNLAFQLIDIYSKVQHKYEDFALALDIVTHDALAERPSTIQIPVGINSRLKEAVERSRKYAALCKENGEGHALVEKGRRAWANNAEYMGQYEVRSRDKRDNQRKR